MCSDCVMFEENTACWTSFGLENIFTSWVWLLLRFWCINKICLWEGSKRKTWKFWSSLDLIIRMWHSELFPAIFTSYILGYGYFMLKTMLFSKFKKIIQIYLNRRASIHQMLIQQMILGTYWVSLSIGDIEMTMAGDCQGIASGENEEIGSQQNQQLPW